MSRRRSQRAQPLSVSEEAAPDRLLDLVDDGTRALIEKRRGSDRRRGWLVRRALAAADAIGILLAFALTEVLFPPDVDPQFDRFGTQVEVLLFALTLPFWIVLGRIYSLYSSDEERTDHSGRRRLLRRLQHGHGRVVALLRTRVLLRFRKPELPEARALLGARDRSRPCLPDDRACAVPAKRRLRPEHAHRRRRACRTACREEAPPASGVQGERRRLRGRAPSGPHRRARKPQCRRTTGGAAGDRFRSRRRPRHRRLLSSIRTRRRSRTSATSTSAGCRSTSSPASSRRWVLTRPCMPPKD